MIIQLLDYIEKISHLKLLSSKDKGKSKGNIKPDIILLILPIRIIGLTSPILSVYILYNR